MLKKYLLSLKCFIDNSYLDEYLDFCFNYTTTEAYTEAHHIIPVSYYKQYYSGSRDHLSRIALKDPYNKLVKLAYSDHFYVHWLLFNCTTGSLKKTSADAVLRMSGNTKKLLKFSKEEILQIKVIIKKDLDFYWSDKDDEYLISIYHKPFTAADINHVAAHLKKTPRAVRSRLYRLKLSIPNWTAETKQWLINNYAVLGKAKCASYLNKTELAIEHMVTRLGISTRQWTHEQTDWLVLNYSTTDTSICAATLNKTITSIENKACTLGLAKIKFWTREQDQWLLENIPPVNTYNFCATKVNRTVSSIKQRIWYLKTKKEL